MSEKQPFIHTYLESKLGGRLSNALKFISTISQKDILQCNSATVTELVRQFAIAIPHLRRDLMIADERIHESDHMTLERKTGDTGSVFFIPVENEIEWFEEIDNQIVASDGYPLAFLDRKRNRIEIRLMLSPKDEDGALKRKLDYRSSLIAQYTNSVVEKVSAFNTDLAIKMLAELNKRKTAITKAEKELETIGLPRVFNPKYAETAVKIEILMKNLGNYMTGTRSDKEESRLSKIRTFIVHGHDEVSLLALKDYLQNTLRLNEPIILRDTPNRGKTIIEKLEREADLIDLVFVLLTPDDKLANGDSKESEKYRARQNVILELGFFLGKFGRESGKVILLHKGSLEIPTDILGIVHIDITNGIKSAGEEIRKELKALNILV